MYFINIFSPMVTLTAIINKHFYMSLLKEPVCSLRNQMVLCAVCITFLVSVTSNVNAQSFS